MQTTLPPPVPAEIRHQPQHQPNRDEGVRIQRWTRIIDTLADRLDPDELSREKSDPQKNPKKTTRFVVQTDKGFIIDRQAILRAALEEIAQLGK
jgi:hypothetical protein